MSGCLFIRCSSFFQRNRTCDGSWHHSLFAYRLFFSSLRQCGVCYACKLCMKYISNLIYSKNPTTDNSRQYNIKLLLPFCTPSPYSVRECTLFVDCGCLVISSQWRQTETISVSGTEAASMREAANGQFGPEVAFANKNVLFFRCWKPCQCPGAVCCIATLKFAGFISQLCDNVAHRITSTTPATRQLLLKCSSDFVLESGEKSANGIQSVLCIKGFAFPNNCINYSVQLAFNINSTA